MNKKTLNIEILLYIIIFITSFVIGTTVSEYLYLDEINEMGQMICSENDLGKFTGFDKKTKIISCESKEKLKPYNGGYIKISDKNE